MKTETNSAIDHDKVKLVTSMDWLATGTEERTLAQLFSLLHQRREMCRLRAATSRRTEQAEQNAIDYVHNINEQIKELLQLY